MLPIIRRPEQVARRYGKQHMLWYIMVCSMIGGISVSVTTGLGAAIVTSAQGDNQVGLDDVHSDRRADKIS